MTNKFYAVKVGKVPGVYTTWKECQDNVEHVPGAKFKSFLTEEEAWAFVGKAEEHDDGVYNSKRDGVVAYVDGSYDHESLTYSYGVVILDGDVETHMSGIGNDAEMALMRNVAGEILGATVAMQYAKDNDIKEITIVHDYAGLADWPLRNWKTNKEGTINYVKHYDEMSKHVKIKFKKAKGHSGNFYNDVADALAKRELGVKTSKTMFDHISSVANTKREG